MEQRRRSDEYAGNQIRLLLNDLKKASHPLKLKAIKRFKNYIEEYQPEIADDTVDFLMTGSVPFTDIIGFGLLYYCGIDSDKHSGQLKRICGPVINLIHWLISFEVNDEFGNIYLERFIHLPLHELLKINFTKHISVSSKGSNLIVGQSRQGSDEDAFKILEILLLDHRNIEGEDDPLDPMQLLSDNKECFEVFERWMQKRTTEEVLQGGRKDKKGLVDAQKRPEKWSHVVFKSVPVQEGEDSGYIELDHEDESITRIPDPLGLSELDLRATQDLYLSGRLSIVPNNNNMAMRRNTAYNPQQLMRRNNDNNDNDSDDDNNISNQPMSILPSDKSFSTSLFLTLVHGGISFGQLQNGIEYLNELLKQQSSRRENLVRLHFGLFIQCADGLEWLKDYKNISNNKRPSSLNKSPVNTTNKTSQVSLVPEVSGEERLKKAQASLESAKVEAQRTLAPILERMKKSRKIKNAEKIIKKMSNILEYPYKMRLALDKSDFGEVIALHQKVQSIPQGINLRIINKIKDSSDLVITDLRNQCLKILYNPSYNYNSLLSCTKILLDLDGLTSCLEVLRKCLMKQISHFIILMKDLARKFVIDITEALKNGKDLNMMRKSSLGRDVGLEEEIDAEIILSARKQINVERKRSYNNNSKKHMRPIGSLDYDNNQNNSFKIQHAMSSNSLESSKIYSKRDNEAIISGFDSEEDDEEDFSESNNDIYNNNTMKSYTTAGKDSNGDNCEMLCANVKQTYVESIVDLMGKWFPCLFRLVTELNIYQNKIGQKSSSPIGNPAMFSNNNNKSDAKNNLKSFASSKLKNQLNKYLHRMNTPPSRVLGLTLSYCSDFIGQLINGLSESFSSFEISSELNSILLEEMDDSDSFHLNQKNNCSADLDLVLFTTFGISLKGPFLTNSLMEIFNLFESMESLLKATTVMSNSPINTTQTPFSIKNDFISEENYFHPSSAYFEPLSALKGFAKQSEITTASKIINRLIELSYEIMKFDQSNVVVNSSSLDDEAKLKETTPNRLETAVNKLEDVIIRCAKKLLITLKRPEWVTEIVHDGVSKVVTSFVESFNREAMCIEDNHTSSISKKDSSSQNRYNNNRSYSTRASLGNKIFLPTIEDELKNSELYDKNKIHVLLDLLKSCVSLRTKSIHRIWMIINKTSDEKGSIGLLNKLFSSDNTSSALDNPIINTKNNNNNNNKLINMKSTSDDVVERSLFNRLSRTIKDQDEYILSSMNEIISLETRTVTNYLNQKNKILKSAVLSGYKLLINQENHNSLSGISHGNIPTHISRILLIIGNEKTFLFTHFNKYTVENGDGKIYLNTDIDINNLDNDDYVTGTEDNDNTILTGQRYNDYIYQELCISVLDIYSEVLVKLKNNSLFSLPDTADNQKVKHQNTSAIKHPITYKQCLIEYEFLKAIMRPLIITSTHYQSNVSSTGNQFDSSASVEQLIKDAKMFSLMITN